MLGLLCAALVACSTTDPRSDEEAALDAAATASEMVTAARGIAALDTPVETLLLSGTGALGEPDVGTYRIRAAVMADAAVTADALDEVVALWVDEFGFEVTDSGDGVTYLSRDAWEAEVGGRSGGATAGRVWFEVTTPSHPTEAAEAAVGRR